MNGDLKELGRVLIKTIVDAIFKPGKSDEERAEALRATLEWGQARLDKLALEQDRRNARVDAAVDGDE